MAAHVIEVDESVEPAELLIEPQRACPDCRSCFWRSTSVVRIPSASQATFVPGDRVQLTLPASFVVVAAGWLYGAPLLALVGGTLIGWAFDPAGDIGALLGAGGGLALAGVALVRARARLERRVRASLVVADLS